MPQQPDTDDLYQRIERDWTRLRQSVGARNQVAEIMLTEAKPLGFDNDTLVVGHHTGALADRINAERNNADIVAVFTEKLGTPIKVRCVVGTNPDAAHVKRPEPREVWNPGEGSSTSEKPEDPAPANSWQAAVAAASQKAAERAQRERDDIPPPPEPTEPFEEAEPEYTREDEERDMAQEARDGERTADRRDATEVAMDLLAAELGAKPL